MSKKSWHSLYWAYYINNKMGQIFYSWTYCVSKKSCPCIRICYTVCQRSLVQLSWDIHNPYIKELINLLGHTVVKILSDSEASLVNCHAISIISCIHRFFMKWKNLVIFALLKFGYIPDLYLYFRTITYLRLHKFTLIYINLHSFT